MAGTLDFKEVGLYLPEPSYSYGDNVLQGLKNTGKFLKIILGASCAVRQKSFPLVG